MLQILIAFALITVWCHAAYAKQFSNSDEMRGVATPVAPTAAVTTDGLPLGVSHRDADQQAAAAALQDDETPTGSMLPRSLTNGMMHSNSVNADAARRQGVSSASQLFRNNIPAAPPRSN